MTTERLTSKQKSAQFAQNINASMVKHTCMRTVCFEWLVAFQATLTSGCQVSSFVNL